MPEPTNPAPPAVSEAINQYVDGELRNVTQYDNREPLDESGVYSLHVLARDIYALGWRDGARYQSSVADGERHRTRERTTDA